MQIFKKNYCFAFVFPLFGNFISAEAGIKLGK
jgi:hypothetical protein